MPRIVVLKLHGSLNWLVKHGERFPYSVGAISHHESWWSTRFSGPPSEGFLKAVKYYLDPEPIIVPPVLTKSELAEHPLLRVIWAKAYDYLAEATQVTFVGYSLPVTDIAAGTLFREALRHLKPTDIKVVTREDEEPKKKALLDAYRAVFPGITETQFDYRGGLTWAKELIGKGKTDS
jgi:hypothetical protein